jgi:hypothetical protein
MTTFLILSVAAVVGLFVLLLVLGAIATVINAFLKPSAQEQAETDQLLKEIAAERAEADTHLP